MNRATVASRWNLELIEANYERWQADPSSVDPSWRFFFEGFELARNPERSPRTTSAPPGNGTLTPTGKTAEATVNGSANGSANGASTASALRAAPIATPPPTPTPTLTSTPSPSPSAIAITASTKAAARVVPPPSSSAAISAEDSEVTRAQAAVTRLIDAYREIGHFLADLDPLRITQPLDSHELLDLDAFDLSEADLDRTFYSRLFNPPYATLREVIETLRTTYCRTIGVEYMHIHDNRIRRWLQQRMEPNRNQPDLEQRKKRRIILKLHAAELFETFLHTHFIGQKRFGLEGAETLIPLLDAVIERGGIHGVSEILIGMPHRGRLNVLANILNKPYGMIFSEFEGHMPPESVGGDGDVKYHLGFSADHYTSDTKKIHLSLTPNPSHLEVVYPVVEGRVRAKQRKAGDMAGKFCVPVVIHGDAAFAGQGLVAESLNLSRLEGYRTGGTIHIIVNNQIGFTTAPRDSRSTPYCTDVAKMIDVPIFHVNGDDPEAVVHVAELAMDFREQFQQDVVIDMVCYRRHGHNEVDEPKFTQPLMYEVIDKMDSVKTLYAQTLIARGELSQNEADTIAETFSDKMQTIYDEVHNRPAVRPSSLSPISLGGAWKGMQRRYSTALVETGIPMEMIETITERLLTFPENFHVNPKILRILEARRKIVKEHGLVDWAFGEALAFGSLLLDGTMLRLSGQDSRRGTFSQRHAVLVDFQTGVEYLPLKHLDPKQADFVVYDSCLSEAAVLAFDYGISLDSPQALVMWEAQFGDFVNGAQVVIDQFIASGESKWGRSSGIVLLLPHGYEGQGPEHSSARLERFLQLYADDNMQVAYPTTSAQYFHLLRRQMKRDFRKPLIVMTPKSLLRKPTSPVADFLTGSFQEVIDDTGVDPNKVKRVVLCSGKVYFDLIARRIAAGKEQDVAVVRLEQFCPWPVDALKTLLDRYPEANEWVWAQEESQNMGGWTFVQSRLRDLFGDVKYVGRDASASPATGLYKVHEREQAELVEHAIGAVVPHVVCA